MSNYSQSLTIRHIVLTISLDTNRFMQCAIRFRFLVGSIFVSQKSIYVVSADALSYFRKVIILFWLFLAKWRFYCRCKGEMEEGAIFQNRAARDDTIFFKLFCAGFFHFYRKLIAIVFTTKSLSACLKNRISLCRNFYYLHMWHSIMYVKWRNFSFIFLSFPG